MRAQIVAIALILAAASAPARAGHSAAERCHGADRACVIESSQTYLDALVSGDAEHVRLAPQAWRVNGGSVTVHDEQEIREGIETFECTTLSHDASGVPLAPDAWRIENCINSGNDAATIRLGLEAPTQNSIVAIENRRWFVDGENATILYVLWTHPSGDPSAPREEWQATFITERFRLANGLIKEIEAVFGTPGSPGAGPDYPDVDGDGWSHIDDNCPDAANPGQEDRGGLATRARPTGSATRASAGT